MSNELILVLYEELIIKNSEEDKLLTEIKNGHYIKLFGVIYVVSVVETASLWNKSKKYTITASRIIPADFPGL